MMFLPAKFLGLASAASLTGAVKVRATPYRCAARARLIAHLLRVVQVVLRRAPGCRKKMDRRGSAIRCKPNLFHRGDATRPRTCRFAQLSFANEAQRSRTFSIQPLYGGRVLKLVAQSSLMLGYQKIPLSHATRAALIAQCKGSNQVELRREKARGSACGRSLKKRDEEVCR